MGDRVWVDLTVPTNRAEEVEAILSENNYGWSDRSDDMVGHTTNYGMEEVNYGAYALLDRIGHELVEKKIPFNASDDGYSGSWGPSLFFWRPWGSKIESRTTDGDGNIVLTKAEWKEIQEFYPTDEIGVEYTDVIWAVDAHLDGPPPIWEPSKEIGK